MSILYINYPPTSTLGYVPQLIYVGTNDTLATVTTPGYLNAAIPTYGNIFTENQMAMVVTTDQLTVILSLSISGSTITLVEPPATGAITSISGTPNEITASPTTGAVVLSIPTTFIAPGSIAATTTISGTTFNSSTLTASTALASDGSKNIVSSSTTATELGFVHGATSNIQNQINAITSSLVTSVSGTANQIDASSSTGNVTLSIDSTFIAPGTVTSTGLLTSLLGLTVTGGVISLGADSADDAINIGTGASSGRQITIGNTTAATGITMNVGAGDFVLDGVGSSAYSIGASTTTGLMQIGGSAQTSNLILGSSSQTNVIKIGNGTGKTTVNILTNSTNGAFNLCSGATTAVITIGGTAQSGTITLGDSSVVNTVNLAIGTGGTTLNIGTGGTNANFIEIGTGTVANVIVIGSTTGAASLTLNSGTAGIIATGVAGVTVSNQAFVTINTSTGALGSTTSGGLVTSISGTANEITASASTGAVTLSIPATFIAPGSIAATTTISGTTFNSSTLTANTALASDGSMNIVSSSTTAAELGYVHGVTSAIQTQLNAITGSIVTSITGTAAQITASSSTGAVTLSIPSSPSFPGIPSSIGYLLVPQTSAGASGTTVLTTSSIQTQYLTGTLAQTFQLPDATTLDIGWKFEFANLSTMSLTITNNGTSTIYVLPPGGYTCVTYVASSGTNGIWGVEASLPSNCAFGSTGGVITGTLGVATSISTPEYLLTGASSGTISILPQAAAGTYNFNLPITVGSSGQTLTSAGGGSAPMTWTTPPTGTVTSVGVSSSTGLIVASTPVTTSGTITVDLPAAIPGRNLLFNGAMLVAQRGTSVAIGSSSVGYTLDRWQLSVGSSQASTVTQSAGPLSGSSYARVQRNSGQTGALSVIYFAQSLTLDMSAGVAGNKITLSFIALAGANFSPTSSNITVTVYSGTGATSKSGIAGAFTGSATPISATQALTGSAAPYTFTSGSVVSSSATQLCVQFSWTPTGTAGANDWVEFTNVSLVVSPTLTNFQNLSYIEELNRCQYFYQLISGAAGYAGNTTSVQLAIIFNGAMRATPTVSSQGALVVTDAAANYTSTSSTLTLTNLLINQGGLLGVGTFTGLTQYRPCQINISVNGLQLTFDAELT